MVAVERAASPALRGRPLIVGGRPGGRGTVAAASREARRAGIRVGMPLTTAALRCPAAVFLDGSLATYLEAARRVDAILRRAATTVEWVSIDEAFVEFPARTGRRGGLDRVEQMRREIAALGLDVACGVARSKTIARIASHLAHPRGLVHVLDGYEAAFLSPLKIELLPDMSPALARRLRAAGIRRIGQLAKLTDADLASIAGRHAARLARAAAGVDEEPVRPAALPQTPFAEDALSSPTADPDAIARMLRARVELTAHDLRVRGLFARSITVRLRYADGHRVSRTTALPAPSALDEVLAGAAEALLPDLLRPERIVSGITVSASGLLDAHGDAAFFPLRGAS